MQKFWFFTGWIFPSQQPVHHLELREDDLFYECNLVDNQDGC